MIQPRLSGIAAAGFQLDRIGTLIRQKTCRVRNLQTSLMFGGRLILSMLLRRENVFCHITFHM